MAENIATFSQFDLNSNINKALTACGYTTPTPIQTKSIPDILAGKDIIASAQTGTGKTAAFLLPALNSLANQQASKKTRVLILTPTRELANQITKAADTFGKFLRFNIVNLVGGMPYEQQIRALHKGADIIVATPGRLLDHMEQKRVDLSNIQMLILDEADRMLDMGFIDDVKYIAKLTPQSRQTLLFSATLDDRLAKLVRDLLKNPLRIDLSNKTLAAPKIKQLLYKATSSHHKLKLLKHLIQQENIFKGIIFSATKINADKLATQLCALGIPAAALHGDLKQRVRTRTLDELRRGKIQLLVATDVAARGLDVDDLSHVFNYDMPKFCEDYVHRIGRTGRAGKEGIAISFVLPTDMRHLQRIERYLGQRFTLISNVKIDESAFPTELKLDEYPAAQPHETRKKSYEQKRTDTRRRSSANDRYRKKGSNDKNVTKEKEAGESRFANKEKDNSKRRFARKGKEQDRNYAKKKFANKNPEANSGKKSTKKRFISKERDTTTEKGVKIRYMSTDKDRSKAS